MTEREEAEEMLTSIVAQALEFCQKTGEPAFEDLDGHELDLFASGAIAAATILIAAFDRAMEIAEMEYNFHDAP